MAAIDRDPGLALRPHPLGKRVEASARALVGIRFRPQGRSAAGLDCLGVVLLAASSAGLRVPPLPLFAMRGLTGEAAAAMLAEAGCRLRPDGVSWPGDILLSSPGTRHVHLAVAVEGGLVEADALLRRVVERPLPTDGAGGGGQAWMLPLELF